MELGLVGAREIGEEVGSPGTAIAAVLRQSRIHSKGARLGNAHERSASDAILQVSIVFNALQGVFFSARVLTDQGGVSAAKSVAGSTTAKDWRAMKLGDL